MYATFREAAGTGSLSMDAGDLDDLLSGLRERFGPVFAEVLETTDGMVVLLNGRNARREGTVLGDGDEVAIFPPVSGG